MTLTEFLLARIAEDEAEWHAINNEPPGSVYDYAQVSIHSIEGRVLAECEAKRSIIATVAPSLMDDAGVGHLCEEVLLHLALVYVDHPDYDIESWTAA